MVQDQAPLILVVEDNLGIQHLIATSLERAGFKVETAATGEEAIRRYVARTPALVLMDILMPGLDGFETTQRIRRLPAGKNVPVIFLTSVGDVESKIKGLELGAEEYLVKPVQVRALISRVKARLRSAVEQNKMPLNRGRCIVLMGSEAGVGVTTLALNLATVLQRVSQQSVQLIDGRTPFGDLAKGLDLPPHTHRALIPYDETLDQSTFMTALNRVSPGISVLAGSPMVYSEPVPGPNWEAQSTLRKIAVRTAAFSIIDAGPFSFWDPPPLTDAQMGINLCVFTPSLTAVENAVKIFEQATRSGRELWFILNRYAMAGRSPIAYIESRLKTVPYGYLPETPALFNSRDKDRILLAMDDPHSAFVQALEDIVNLIKD